MSLVVPGADHERCEDDAVARMAKRCERLQIGWVDPASGKQTRGKLLHEQLPMVDAVLGIGSHPHRNRLRADICKASRSEASG